MRAVRQPKPNEYEAKDMDTIKIDGEDYVVMKRTEYIDISQCFINDGRIEERKLMERRDSTVVGVDPDISGARMNECDVCKRVIGGNAILVTINEELFEVCGFDCKDVITGGRSVDVGCGIIDGDKVRDVKMCGKCPYVDMPVTCYAIKRNQGRTIMFVGYGRVKHEEG